MTDSALQIQNLVHRYAELIDLGDFDALGHLLGGAEVGSGEHPGFLTGHDAVTAMFTSTTRRYPDGTPRTKHVTTNLIVEVDDDAGAATCRSYFTVLQATDVLPLQPIVAGRYHDRFVREGASWRFAERRFFLDLVGDVSQHQLIPLPSTD
ncbi:MAG TPA: nuclear transport factor 2 family protein [Acidimicrobiales bacterium]